MGGLGLGPGWRAGGRDPPTGPLTPHCPTLAAARWCVLLQEVAAKLSALAIKRGSQDNVGIVVIDLGRVDWSQQPAAKGLFGGLFGSR